MSCLGSLNLHPGNVGGLPRRIILENREATSKGQESPPGVTVLIDNRVSYHSFMSPLFFPPLFHIAYDQLSLLTRVIRVNFRGNSHAAFLSIWIYKTASCYKLLLPSPVLSRHLIF
jgi:hypothetical protein